MGIMYHVNILPRNDRGISERTMYLQRQLETVAMEQWLSVQSVRSRTIFEQMVSLLVSE
jgi:hypothetical protein